MGLYKKHEKLLTVNQVAERLQCNRSTVYRYKKELGGFYLFGNRALRFTEEGVNGYLERQGAGRLDLHVPIQREDVRRKGIQDQGRSSGNSRRTSEKGQGDSSTEFYRQRLEKRVQQILTVQ